VTTTVPVRREVHWLPRSAMSEEHLRALELENFGDQAIGTFLVPEADAVWMVAGTVYEREGRVFIGRLTIEPCLYERGRARAVPRKTPLELGVEALRSIRLGEIISDVRAQVTVDWEPLREPVKRRPRGRPPRPDAFYWVVASDYLDIQRTHGSKGITQRLIQRYNTPDRENREVATETMVGWIKKATKKQFLGPGTPGTAGRTAGRNFLRRPSDQLSTESQGDGARQ